MDLVYDLLIRDIPPEQRADVDEVLTRPLWVVPGQRPYRTTRHPETTPEAKQRRAAQMQAWMSSR